MKIQRNKGKLKNQIKKKHIIESDSHDDGGKLWFPSGSILFNLRCSGRWYGAFKEGTFVNIIGDSDGGKTIMCLTGMAWMANMSKFDDYDLIFDDAEEGDSFDHEEMFGKKFAGRVKAPRYDEKGNPVASQSIEQLYDNLMNAVEGDKPFCYLVDSWDAIDSDKEIKKELENREHREKGHLSKVKGSFQASKQKYASMFFRHFRSRIKKKRSLVIIISQTRDNLNAMSFVKHYRAGGRALKFYCSIEAWLAGIGPLTKTVNKITYEIGIKVRAKVTKNRFTGRKTKDCDFDIYPEIGIDDIGSCIRYLIAVGHWSQPKKGATIKADDFDMRVTEKKLISWFDEKKSRQIRLYKLCGKKMKEIEDLLSLNRKRKFD